MIRNRSVQDARTLRRSDPEVGPPTPGWGCHLASATRRVTLRPLIPARSGQLEREVPSMTRLTLRLAALGATLLAAPSACTAAEPPPAGPPWVRELAAAQKTALEKGTPIFIYFTKKY